MNWSTLKELDKDTDSKVPLFTLVVKPPYTYTTVTVVVTASEEYGASLIDAFEKGSCCPCASSQPVYIGYEKTATAEPYAPSGSPPCISRGSHAFCSSPSDSRPTLKRGTGPLLPLLAP